MAANASRTGEAANLMIDKDHNRGLRGLRRFAGVIAAVAAAIVFGAGIATNAFAQDGTVVIGGSGAPDVQVDLNAITGGGPSTPYSPAGRQLLMPNAGKIHGLKLRPPGSPSGVKRTTAKVTPKPEAPTTQATGEPTGDEPLIPPPSAEPAPPAPPPSASAPTPLAKSAEEPPPPPAQKTLPVESAPLAPAARSTAPAKATEKTAEAAAPETPPPPPPPAPSKAETPPSPAPAPAATKTESAAPPPPPPPAPAAASKTESAFPPPPIPVTPAPATSAETAPPPAPNQQIAALPPAPSFSMEKPTAIPFTVGASTLADPAKQMLGSVAQTLNGNADLRLQIVAYATGSDDNASQARRLSLSRALAVRSFLIDAGIRSTRMDVRALGNKFDSGPGDRVDLIVVKP